MVIRPSVRNAAGFSLVECLVTIAIIACALLLISPVVNQMRQQANTARCRNNLRQIGLAILNYANEHNGMLPGPVPSVQRSTVSRSTMGTPAALPDFLATYLGYSMPPPGNNASFTVEQFVCPASRDIITRATGAARCYINDSNPAPGVRLTPFGYSSTGVEPTPPMNLRSFENPGSFRALNDDDRRKDSPVWVALKRPVHGDVRNVLYLDGSARSVDPNY